MLHRKLASSLSAWQANTEFLQEVHDMTLKSVLLGHEYMMLASIARAFIHWQEEFGEKYWGRFLAVFPPHTPRRVHSRPYRRGSHEAIGRFVKAQGGYTGPARPIREPRRNAPWKEELPAKPKAKVVKPASMPHRRWVLAPPHAEPIYKKRATLPHGVAVTQVA